MSAVSYFKAYNVFVSVTVNDSYSRSNGDDEDVSCIKMCSNVFIY